MTEAQWLTCKDPDVLFRFLCGQEDRKPRQWLVWLGFRGEQSDAPGPRPARARQLRLFACACCRRIEDLFRDERSLKAVEAGEQNADGRLSEEEAKAAETAAWEALDSLLAMPVAGRDPTGLALQRSPGPMRPWLSAAWAATAVVRGQPDAVVAGVVRAATEMATEWGSGKQAAAAVGAAARETLLRDIFGNPFRPVPMEPSWLTWHDGIVRHIAQSIYADSTFAELPVLADALEEAGCADPALLGHLRGPGPHVRGCWAVDLALDQSWDEGRGKDGRETWSRS